MPQFVSQAIRIDGEHALAAGDPGRAWSHVDVFVAHRHLYDAPREWPVLAMAAAAASVLDQQESLDRRTSVRELLAGARSCTVRPVWESLALAELDDDLDSWRNAAEVTAGPTAPVHLRPYAQLRQARHLTAPRDRARLRELLEEAAATSARLGAGLLTGWIADLARRAGVAVTGVHTLAAPTLLTPREVEVLRLVAEGRSNSEIGAALFISIKTVSVHVSNILAKLGVSGRGEAAALAHRTGLLDETST